MILYEILQPSLSALINTLALPDLSHQAITGEVTRLLERNDLV